ncbi:unnamed protein product [Lupinus luteus]|uniref:Hcy-binding domain-containing protein n=1 Tax=Lupinus luteus TaxID=3873 RepID=A0AAV1WG16_LUPLU
MELPSITLFGVLLISSSSGCYEPDVSLEKLKDFHRRRLQVLIEAGPDMLALKTIPNKLEARACIELLEEENVQIPSWIRFTTVDGENAPSGESFEDCLEVINNSNRVHAVGINCAPPHFIDNLICKFKHPSKYFDDHDFESHARRWRDLGAKIIGGCCRTTPLTIKIISDALGEKS